MVLKLLSVPRTQFQYSSNVRALPVLLFAVFLLASSITVFSNVSARGEPTVEVIEYGWSRIPLSLAPLFSAESRHELADSDCKNSGESRCLSDGETVNGGFRFRWNQVANTNDEHRLFIR